MTTITDKPKRASKAAKAETAIVCFKGFNADLRCRDFQFEVGKTYEHSGPVAACASGFHACENPLDILNYYPLIGGDGRANRFARVTVSGALSRHKGDSKIAAGRIVVDMELTIPAFTKTGVDWLIAQTKDNKGTSSDKRDAQLAASGDYSQLAASGNSSQLAASGDYSKLAASGDYSQLAASGNYSKLEITGAKSAAAAVGPNSRIKAAAGTPVAICEYGRNGAPIGFATGIAGQNGIPADVWLIARDGKLVEAA